MCRTDIPDLPQNIDLETVHFLVIHLIEILPKMIVCLSQAVDRLLQFVGGLHHFKELLYNEMYVNPDDGGQAAAEAAQAGQEEYEEPF